VHNATEAEKQLTANFAAAQSKNTPQ
jgi:hypothetical protein